MAKIPLSIGENYVSDWGKWEGVRDLAQNVRDAVAMLGCEQKFHHDGKLTLTMSSIGATIDASKLLLGESTKKGDARAAGEYGEGLKLAMKALVCADVDVKIRTGDEVWSPSFEPSDLFGGKKVLVVQTRKVKFKNAVEITLVGITRSEWTEFSQKLLFVTPPDPKDVEETSHGRVLFAHKHKGKLFVHGIYVKDVEDMTLGYDLCNLKVDRDRRMADIWDIRHETTQAFVAATKKRASMRAQLYQNAKSSRSVEARGSSLLYQGEEVHAALIAEFDKEYGEGAIAVATATDAQKIEYLGGRAAVISDDGLRAIIEKKRGNAATVMARLMTTPAESHLREDLEPKEREVLELAEAYMEEIGEKMRIEVVTFREEERLGLASMGNGRILIARHNLKTGIVRTMMTLVHETAHVLSNAGDGDPRHHAEVLRLFGLLWDAKGSKR